MDHEMNADNTDWAAVLQALDGVRLPAPLKISLAAQYGETGPGLVVTAPPAAARRPRRRRITWHLVP